MKKLTALLLALLIALSLAACTTSDNSADTADTTDATASDTADTTNTADTTDTADGTVIGGTEDSAQIPNPWTDCETVDEAAELAGFDMTVPDEAAGQAVSDISAMEDQTIQVIYGDTSEEDSDLTYIRKGVLSDDETDISGDYNSYSEEASADNDGITVTLKGEDGLVYLATWTVDGYAFSINSSAGLAQADMLALAAQVG